MIIDWTAGQPVTIEGDQRELESLADDIRNAIASGEVESALVNQDGVVPLIVRCAEGTA